MLQEAKPNHERLRWDDFPQMILTEEEHLLRSAWGGLQTNLPLIKVCNFIMESFWPCGKKPSQQGTKFQQNNHRSVASGKSFSCITWLNSCVFGPCEQPQTPLKSPRKLPGKSSLHHERVLAKLHIKQQMTENDNEPTTLFHSIG